MARVLVVDDEKLIVKGSESGTGWPWRQTAPMMTEKKPLKWQKTEYILYC